MRRLFVGKRDEHRFFFKVEKYRGFGERKILKKKTRRQKGEHFERIRNRELGRRKTIEEQRTRRPKNEKQKKKNK